MDEEADGHGVCVLKIGADEQGCCDGTTEIGNRYKDCGKAHDCMTAGAGNSSTSSGCFNMYILYVMIPLGHTMIQHR